MTTANLGQHIHHRYDSELESLRSRVVSMGGLAERQISDALTALRDHAFDQLKLHRLEGKVSDRNTRSVHLFLNSGFIIEGCMRDSDLIDGRYHNGYLFGVLDSDRH